MVIKVGVIVYFRKGLIFKVERFVLNGVFLFDVL